MINSKISIYSEINSTKLYSGTFSRGFHHFDKEISYCFCLMSWSVRSLKAFITCCKMNLQWKLVNISILGTIFVNILNL